MDPSHARKLRAQKSIIPAMRYTAGPTSCHDRIGSGTKPIPAISVTIGRAKSKRKICQCLARRKRPAIAFILCRDVEWAHPVLHTETYTTPYPGLCGQNRDDKSSSVGIATSISKPSAFRRPIVASPAFHQILRGPDVLDINDVVSPFHRISTMSGNSHPHDLRNARAAHVANCGATQIVKFQVRDFGGFACLIHADRKYLIGVP